MTKTVLLGSPIPTKLRSKHQNKSLYTAVVIFTTLAIILTGSAVYHTYFQPQHNALLLQTPYDNANLVNFTEEEDTVDCVDILNHDDPCDFIRTTEACQLDGLIPWLELRYCYLPSHTGNSIWATILSSLIMTVGLVILLNTLGDTADTFFVSALSQVASELKLSGPVAGLVFVSLGNASPDISTTIASIRSGDFDLVLSALAGACVCISFLVLGSALASSPPGRTHLPRFQFIRSIAGYIIAIGVFVVIAARGEIKVWGAFVLLAIYALYLLCNIIYLQRQEAQLRALRQNGRKLKFLKQFRSFRNLDEASQTLLHGYVDSAEDQALTINNNPNNDTYSPPVVYKNKNEQTDMETQYVDLDIVDAVNMADEKKLHHLHSHNHADHSHSSAITSEITPNNDDDDGDDGDNEVDVDQTTYMNGISWPNPEWETETSSAKLLLLKLLWILSFPLSLTRWVSIPSTETRPDFLVSVKRVFFFISPFFLSLFLLFTITDGYQYDPEDKLLWILLPSIGCGVSILLFIFYSCIVKPRVAQYHDTRAQLRLEEAKARRNDANNLSREELSRLTALHIEYELDNDDDCEVKPTIMSFYQIIISLLAFISAIAWLSFISDEIVGLLGSLGLMFNISSSLLGLTVLALGNSLPDLIAGMSLAAKGKIGVSYAAIFGAPVLSSTFGFGLGLLIKFVKDQSPVDILDRVVTFDVGAQLWLSFGATIFGVILHCIVFPFSGYTPTKRYGIALICLYLLFLAAAVVFEVTS